MNMFSFFPGCFSSQVLGAGDSVRVPSRLLLGIVPEVLLRSFDFWQYQVRSYLLSLNSLRWLQKYFYTEIRFCYGVA